MDKTNTPGPRHNGASQGPDVTPSESVRAAAAQFDEWQVYMQQTQPDFSLADPIPPNPRPPGLGITATMLRRLAGDGPRVPDNAADTTAANRMAVARSRLDRMAEILAQAAEQSAPKPRGPRP